MNATWIITTFVLIDTAMTNLDHQTDVRAKVPDSEVVTVALVAAKYFANNHQIALDVDGERLERRDVERVDAGEGLARFLAATLGEFGQRREKAGQRFTGTGRGDQQQALAAILAGSRPGQQLQLMVTRLPALFAEPAEEGGRQKGKGGISCRHCPKVVDGPGKRRGERYLTAARYTDPSGG